MSSLRDSAKVRTTQRVRLDMGHGMVFAAVLKAIIALAVKRYSFLSLRTLAGALKSI